MSNDNTRMKSKKDLEHDLEKYRDLYDKFDHNPDKQIEIIQIIQKCIRQIEMWEKLYKVIDDEDDINNF